MFVLHIGLLLVVDDAVFIKSKLTYLMKIIMLIAGSMKILSYRSLHGQEDI